MSPASVVLTRAPASAPIDELSLNQSFSVGENSGISGTSRESLFKDCCTISKDSPLAKRLSEIVHTIAPSCSDINLCIKEAGQLHHFRASWIDGHKSNGDISLFMPDPAVTLEKLASNLIFTSVGNFTHLEHVDIPSGRHNVYIAVDPHTNAASAEEALRAEQVVGNQRFIIERTEEDSRYPSAVRSAVFNGVKNGIDGPEVAFIADSGTPYALPVAEISAIYRAGKEHTVETGNHSGKVRFEGAVSKTIGFESLECFDYFARFQEVTIGYTREIDGSYRSGKINAQLIGMESVPVLSHGGADTGRTQKYLFALSSGADNLNRLHAIRADEIEYITGHAGSQSEVAGNSRSSKALGTFGSYRQGEALFERT